MTTLQDVKDELAQAKADAAAERAEVVAGLKALEDKITELTGAGGGASNAELAELLVSVKDLRSDISGIYAPAAPQGGGGPGPGDTGP